MADDPWAGCDWTLHWSWFWGYYFTCDVPSYDWEPDDWEPDDGDWQPVGSDWESVDSDWVPA